MIIEILIVVVLSLVNGVLAMSELAVVSARPARLKVMAAEPRPTSAARSTWSKLIVSSAPRAAASSTCASRAS